VQLQIWVSFFVFKMLEWVTEARELLLTVMKWSRIQSSTSGSESLWFRCEVAMTRVVFQEIVIRSGFRCPGSGIRHYIMERPDLRLA